MKNYTTLFIKLKKYCESEDFKGWDLYDGLNSSFFSLIGINNDNEI